MGLQPVAQEFRRHRNLDRASLAAIEFDPAEPACENVLAQFLAQTSLYTPPFSFDSRRVEFESGHWNTPL
jgi:hypothetical protein